jgi:hypothetical protein
MKVLKMFRTITVVAAGAVLAGTPLWAGGCSHFGGNARQTWEMGNSGQVPAAMGKVKVNGVKDGNAEIEIDVHHLAKPADAFGNAQVYVVWFQRDAGGPPQNQGELRLDNDLEATFKTKTAFRQFSVFVTAEGRANVSAPSANQVLSTSVSIAG